MDYEEFKIEEDLRELKSKPADKLTEREIKRLFMIIEYKNLQQEELKVKLKNSELTRNIFSFLILFNAFLRFLS